MLSKNRNILTILQNLRRKNYEEKSFLDTMANIMEYGNIRNSRTGVDIKSVFAPRELRFSLLNNSFPLLTTRKLPLRHIFEELKWFLNGDTNVKNLKDKGVYIWNGNSSREFLDANNRSHIPTDSIGKSYGYQFRKSGDTYDQLEKVVDEIKNNPTSRRLIINLWNPSQLVDMAIPPCMFNYQFYVHDGYLSVKVTQRSSDIALAGGWNIASASLFTILLAHSTGLKPKELIWSVGDAHIYSNQFSNVSIQITREPLPFPKLYIMSKRDSPEKYEYCDLVLENYYHFPSIKYSFNV